MACTEAFLMEAQIDRGRTKEELMNELVEMRERIAELEESTVMHKKVEETIQYEQTFRLFFEKSIDPILLFDGEMLIDCNEAAVKLMGCSGKDQLIGLRPSDLSPEKQPYGCLSSEKAQAFANAAFKGGFGRFEWLHRAFDGRDILVDVSHTTIPIKGRQISYIVWRDITEQKCTEEALRESQTRYQAMFASMKNSIVVYEAINNGEDFAFKRHTLLR